MQELPFSSTSRPDDVPVALLRIASTFEKLVFLANLGDSASGSSAELPASVARKPEVDVLLRRTRQELFFGWVRLPLSTQTEEIGRYFERQGVGHNSQIVGLLDQWIQEKAYERLVLAEAGEQTRNQFCLELRAILRLLRIRLGLPEESRGR